LVSVVCDVSTLVTWPVSANEDTACAVVLGSAGGKAMSSSRGPKLGTYSDWGLSSVLVINKHLSHQ